MLLTDNPPASSSAAATRAPAGRPLELLEARQCRDSLRLLLGKEHSAMADFLVALADFDGRRGWEALGHASLFAFLRAELGLSTSSTYWRSSAARLLQDFPELVDPLRQGRLCLTTIAELGKVLTRENQSAVLPRFLGLSSREAKEVVAEFLPRENPPLREVVTPLVGVSSVRLFAAGSASSEPASSEPRQADTHSESFRAPETRAPPSLSLAPRDDAEPLTAELSRLHMTVDREFLGMLDAARDGLSHALPNATAKQVLQAGLEALLEKQAKARGLVKQPRKIVEAAPAGVQATAPAPADPPRHRREGRRAAIPAAVRRAVWARDGGRCSWPLDGGGPCGSTHRLELDHVVPWARGGDDSPANLRLTCQRHNRLAARREFGAEVVGRYAG